MISTFERGITEPKFSQIHAICEVLEVTPDFLFGYVQIPLKINNKNRNPDFYYLLKNYLNKENMTEESIYELLEIIKTLVKGILSKK